MFLDHRRQRLIECRRPDCRDADVQDLNAITLLQDAGIECGHSKDQHSGAGRGH